MHVALHFAITHSSAVVDILQYSRVAQPRKAPHADGDSRVAVHSYRDHYLPVDPHALLKPRLEYFQASERVEETSYFRPRVSIFLQLVNRELDQRSAQGKATLLGEPKLTSQRKKKAVAACVWAVVGGKYHVLLRFPRCS